MKHGGKAEICVLVGVLLSTSTIAMTSVGADSPYNAIIERNVFNLHPPPPPINPADLIKKTPPPKIILTGVAAILGKNITYLTTPAIKPGAPPDSVMLTEGQALNDIEVKRIDVKAGVVEVINHGEPQTLDFEHDGAKPSGPPVGGIPPPMAMPFPSRSPVNVTPLPAPGNVIRPLRSMSPRNGSTSDNENNGFGGNAGSANLNSQNQNSSLTPEEQVALIEIQRVKYQQENNPIGKILPPTELTPEVTGQPAPQ